MKMKYTSLGRSGLEVSRLCLGTMNFGKETPEAEAHRILDRGLELGFNFLDTANVYGGKPGEGVTEQILGRWFAHGGGRRERSVVATKVYGRMGDGVNDGRCSALHIKRACEASLRRMGVDHIDLYQMHHIDRRTPWDEVWQAMEQLVREGKVLYVGSSNFAGWHIATACLTARERHFFGLVSEQSLYSLLTRTVELEVMPACRHFGVGMIPWSPLEGGLLGGVLGKIEKGRRAGEKMQKRIAKHRPELERWEALCRELGEEPANVALAWLLAVPGVTAPIIGPRTIEQLDGAMRALEIAIDADLSKKIDAIWPGPGGEAPEAYAW
jgi:aryl-alcohol dehydrogenase-like predicted oxidoreductase